MSIASQSALVSAVLTVVVRAGGPVATLAVEVDASIKGPAAVASIAVTVARSADRSATEAVAVAAGAEVTLADIFNVAGDVALSSDDGNEAVVVDDAGWNNGKDWGDHYAGNEETQRELEGELHVRCLEFVSQVEFLLLLGLWMSPGMIADHVLSFMRAGDGRSDSELPRP